MGDKEETAELELCPFLYTRPDVQQNRGRSLLATWLESLTQRDYSLARIGH